jgi:hypothetical protein
MSSVGEGLAAIGHGLYQLENDLRDRAKRKIDIILQQSGGDWTQAAPIIQNDPNLRNAFRKAYGVDFDVNRIQKSIEQRIKEQKLAQEEGDYTAKTKARGYAEERTNPLLAYTMTQPESAGAAIQYNPWVYLNPGQQTQAAMQKTNVALDPNEALRAVNMALNMYGTVDMLSPEVLKAAGYNPNSMGQQATPTLSPNAGMAAMTGMMQANPMLGGIGQGMQSGMEALQQGAQTLFGGGESASPWEAAGSRFYSNKTRTREQDRGYQLKVDRLDLLKKRYDDLNQQFETRMTESRRRYQRTSGDPINKKFSDTTRMEIQDARDRYNKQWTSTNQKIKSKQAEISKAKSYLQGLSPLSSDEEMAPIIQAADANLKGLESELAALRAELDSADTEYENRKKEILKGIGAQQTPEAVSPGTGKTRHVWPGYNPSAKGK